MNIRIIVLCLMFAASLALAQEPQKPAKARAAERAAMLETLQKGKQIQGSREQYDICLRCWRWRAAPMRHRRKRSRA